MARATRPRVGTIPPEWASSRPRDRPIPPEWASSRPRAHRARVLADTLRQRIGAGEFVDGVLDDERVLARQLGASRNAVREALGLLRDEGLIERRRGVGTTVVTPTYGHGLDRLTGLAEMLTGVGTVVNEVLVAEAIADPPPAAREQLRLEDGAEAVHVERVRRLNGVPLSLDSTYLVADIGRAVLGGDLVGRDVFALIEEVTGSLLGYADVAVHAANVDAGAAALLEIPAGTAIFAIERLTHLADGRPVDMELLQVRADRLTLHATLYRGTSMPVS